jgi:hypothetical protein
MVAGTSGKAIRFLVTTLLGAAYPPAGFIGGLLDSFIVEKMLPRSGITAFINELYPSLFESRTSRIPKNDLSQGLLRDKSQ